MTILGGYITMDKHIKEWNEFLDELIELTDKLRSNVIKQMKANEGKQK